MKTPDLSLAQSIAIGLGIGLGFGAAQGFVSPWSIVIPATLMLADAITRAARALNADGVLRAKILQARAEAAVGASDAPEDAPSEDVEV